MISCFFLTQVDKLLNAPRKSWVLCVYWDPSMFDSCKNVYLQDFMYSYDCHTYWDPSIHTAPMT